MSNPTRMQPLVEMEASDYTSPDQRAASRRAASPLSRIRAVLGTTGGKIGLTIFALAMIVFVVMQFRSFSGAAANDWQRIRIMNPATGAMGWVRVGATTMPAGFHPVEYCFNNDCGPAGGTPVVRNSYLGKAEPTVCPKCGANVVVFNPRPEEYIYVIPADQK